MMNTIVIPVGKGRPEDDLLTLVEILKGLFPGQTVTVQDALLIETDVPAIAAILKQAAGTNVSINGGSEAKFKCVNCGAPVSKSGKRCRNCAQQAAAKRKKEAGTEINVEMAVALDAEE
jgi:hypothetical protein